MSDLTIELVTPELTIEIPGQWPATDSQIADYLAARPAYNSNEEALAALGAGKVYRAGPSHVAATEGTFLLSLTI